METITVDMIPGYTKAAECNTSQNDNGRRIKVKLTNAGEPYYLNDNDTILLRVRTTSGDMITQDVVNTHEDYVTITATSDMTAASGMNACVLTMTNGTRRESTAVFIMRVERKT